MIVTQWYKLSPPLKWGCPPKMENVELTDKSSDIFDSDCIFIHHSMMLAFASKN